MKKYGLQLRVQPQQKKQLTKPSIPKPLGFNDDDDDDNVEREILRQSYKNKSHKDIEEQHKKALEEDPSVFDYDGVYDKMKEKQIKPIEQDRKDRQSRYIAAIKEKVKQRERENEIIYERKLAKERSQDEHLYADKDKFVTGAYKRKLAEQEKWKEEERLREMREEKDDVTKKTDISDFYFNLSKNVAFGADKKTINSRKPEIVPEKVVAESPTQEDSPPASDTNLESSSQWVKRNEDETERRQPLPEKESKAICDTPEQGEAGPSVAAANEKRRSDHHKKSEDAVAAAKERFLARKKAKKQ